MSPVPLVGVAVGGHSADLGPLGSLDLISPLSIPPVHSTPPYSFASVSTLTRVGGAETTGAGARPEQVCWCCIVIAITWF